MKGDVCAVCELRACMQSCNPDCLVHLTADNHVARSIADASNFMRTNVTGTFVLLEARRDYLAETP